jgi:predicted transcriptional regulator
VDNIITSVSNITGVEKAKLFEDTRTRDFVMARQIISNVMIAEGFNASTAARVLNLSPKSVFVYVSKHQNNMEGSAYAQSFNKSLELVRSNTYLSIANEGVINSINARVARLEGVIEHLKALILT